MTPDKLVLLGMGLVLLLAVGVFGGFFAVSGSQAMEIEAKGLAVPPELEAAYRQMGVRMGISWAYLAAWDAAENRFALPILTVEQIFRERVAAALERRWQQALAWCRAHPDEVVACPPGEPELTAVEEEALWREAHATWRALLERYLERRARAIAVAVADLEHDPEPGLARVMGPTLAGQVMDLFYGYQVIAALQADEDDILIEYAGEPTDWEPVDGFAWPVIAPITSRFGLRVSPIDGVRRLHAGIDLGVDTGTPVRASREGRVIRASYDPTYGQVVEIVHGDGYRSLYAHNSTLEVAVGHVVPQGNVVAKSGSTGRSTGPHLHFEIWYNTRPVDPLLLLTQRSGRE